MAALLPYSKPKCSSKICLERKCRYQCHFRESKPHSSRPANFRCSKRHSRCQAQRPTQVEAEAVADYVNPDAVPADYEEVKLGGDDEAEDDSAEEDEEEEEEEEEEEDKEEEDEYGDEEVDEQSQSPTAEYTEEEYADMCNLPMVTSFSCLIICHCSTHRSPSVYRACKQTRIYANC
jgi:hypothetical protein